MTTLAIRQAVAQIVTTTTTGGTADNPVATTHFYQPDQIPFESTPALVVTCSDENEHFTTMSASMAESTITIEVEYLDAPLVGDDLQAAMADVEAWFDRAKINLRRNNRGIIGSAASWAFLKSMRTQIDKPLMDEGRVLYHGCLYVTVLANLLQS
jgi:hypothetical protein